MQPTAKEIPAQTKNIKSLVANQHNIFTIHQMPANINRIDEEMHYLRSNATTIDNKRA
jgi:transposase